MLVYKINNIDLFTLITMLLYADDTVVLTESVDDL